MLYYRHIRDIVTIFIIYPLHFGLAFAIFMSRFYIFSWLHSIFYILYSKSLNVILYLSIILLYFFINLYYLYYVLSFILYHSICDRSFSDVT
jgi:hypothetical protein